VLANHGAIVFGDSFAKALWRAAEVETLAQQYFVACQMVSRSSSTRRR
jgi:L-fuculose-phosphate aldolase